MDSILSRPDGGGLELKKVEEEKDPLPSNLKRASRHSLKLPHMERYVQALLVC